MDCAIHVLLLCELPKRIIIAISEMFAYLRDKRLGFHPIVFSQETVPKDSQCSCNLEDFFRDGKSC